MNGFMKLKLDSVWSNKPDKHNKAYAVVMDQTIEYLDLYKGCIEDENVEIPQTNIRNAKALKKCNQCNYVSSQAGNFMRHLKTHSGEKQNKCNQCDFASY